MKEEDGKAIYEIERKQGTITEKLRKEKKKTEGKRKD